MIIYRKYGGKFIMTIEKLILCVIGVIVCAAAGIGSWWFDNRGAGKKHDNVEKENKNEEN